MTIDLRASFGGKSVFITGHTGFKGSWLCLWLARLDADVTGYALEPPTYPSNFVAADVHDTLVRHYEADVNDAPRLRAAVREAQPDFVLHLAAQTTVIDGYKRPRDTFATNVMGTVNVLEAVRDLERPCSVVVVTSDKCYRNDERGKAFAEDDPLGGDDPYSASKAGTEIVAQSYRKSFFPPERLAQHGIALATARAGNVIGGGDWTAHGLMADVIRGIWTNKEINLRHPNAVRPWQHVLEPLSGYLHLAAALTSDTAPTLRSAYNFGPAAADHQTVDQVVEAFIRSYGSGRSLARTSAVEPDQHEATLLRLATDRAVIDLGWSARWRLQTAVERTAAWYRSYKHDPSSANAACVADLEAYEGSHSPASRSNG